MSFLNVQSPAKVSVQTAFVSLLQVCLAAGVIGCFGKVAIPVWFSPVPIATQNVVILLIACFLGSQKAFLSTALFLLQGALGSPVFFGSLVGPTGGYLIGYLFAAYVTGLWMQRREKTAKNAWHAMLLGVFTVYVFGLPHLAQFVGWASVWKLGFLPYIGGDLLKIALAAGWIERKGRFF